MRTAQLWSIAMDIYDLNCPTLIRLQIVIFLKSIFVRDVHLKLS
jgi:hypothetical protein